MKKIYFTLLLLLLVFQLSKAQYMETFESFTGSGTAKPTSFTSNSQSFTLTTTSCTTGGTFGIFIPSQSWLNCSGSTVSNGSGAYGVGTSCTAGNCSGTSFGTNNGFTYIDFSTAGGSNNTAYTIDELEVQGTGSVNYIALDNFTWTAAATLSAVNSQTNIACYGGTGAASVSVSGGSSPYSYSWAPSGGTGATATGLAAGSYTCTITDASSSVLTKVFTITQPSSALSATSSFTNTGCFGGSNGRASVSASGGTPSYTYAWAPSGGTGATATGLAAGNYTCTITDANSCIYTKVVAVGQPTVLTATTSSTSVSCFGGSNGTAHVTPSGGTSPYTYSWAPSGGTGATASGLSAGSYTCTITDNNSCTATKVVVVSQPSSGITATTSSTSVSCFGGSNGTAGVTASGGTSPYTYSWAPSGGTGATASGLSAGSYTCTITDNNNCMISKLLNITQPSAALSANAISTSISCNGGSATVTVTGTGGTSPYAGTGSFTDVAGSYTYTVTDDNGCLASTNITITEPSVLTASVSATSISCNGGSATVTVTDNGGTAPYISPGSITEAAGSYTYTVTDNNGCTASTSITISQPAAIATSQSFTVCAGGNVTVGTHTYATTGTYTDVLTSLGGCDSTITTNLTVQNSIDIGTTVTGGTVSSNQAGATYQWIDCTNGDAPIAGATNQSYSGTGTFAVTITLNGCVATSTCVSIVSTDIPNVNAISNIINIYPNPNSGTFTLTSTSESVYQIINELGQTIKTLPLNSGNNYEVNVNGLPGGIYFIIGSSAGIPVKKKIIVTQ
jgi:hypothetical protein